jgi:hypothetical protein
MRARLLAGAVYLEAGKVAEAEAVYQGIFGLEARLPAEALRQPLAGTMLPTPGDTGARTAAQMLGDAYACEAYALDALERPEDAARAIARASATYGVPLRVGDDPNEGGPNRTLANDGGFLGRTTRSVFAKLTAKLGSREAAARHFDPAVVRQLESWLQGRRLSDFMDWSKAQVGAARQGEDRSAREVALEARYRELTKAKEETPQWLPPVGGRRAATPNPRWSEIDRELRRVGKERAELAAARKAGADAERQRRQAELGKPVIGSPGGGGS